MKHVTRWYKRRIVGGLFLAACLQVLAPSVWAAPLQFSIRPTSPVHLPGKAPGGAVRFSTTGGVAPITYTVAAGSLSELFEVDVWRPIDIGVAPKGPVDMNDRLLRWKGLDSGFASGTSLPTLQVVITATDASGVRVATGFLLQLTQAKRKPAIAKVEPFSSNSHKGPVAVLRVTLSDWFSADPGTDFECRYPPALRYRCDRTVIDAGTGASGQSVIRLLVPDFGRGPTLDLIAVNGYGESSKREFSIVNPDIAVTETEKFWVLPAPPEDIECLYQSYYGCAATVDTGPSGVALSSVSSCVQNVEQRLAYWRSVTYSDVIEATLLGNQSLPKDKLELQAPSSGTLITSTNPASWTVPRGMNLSARVTYTWYERRGQCGNKSLAD